MENSDARKCLFSICVAPHQIKFYLGRWREYYCSTDSSVGTQSGFRLLFPPLLSVSEAAIYWLSRAESTPSLCRQLLKWKRPQKIQQELETRDQCLVPRSFCIFFKGTNDIKCFSGVSVNNQYDCTSRGDVSSCQSVKGLAYSLQGR